MVAAGACGTCHDAHASDVAGIPYSGTDLSFLPDADPSTHRVLLVESAAKLESKRWHVQRAHFVVTAMRRFADELRDAGRRRAADFTAAASGAALLDAYRHALARR